MKHETNLTKLTKPQWIIMAYKSDKEKLWGGHYERTIANKANIIMITSITKLSDPKNTRIIPWTPSETEINDYNLKPNKNYWYLTNAYAFYIFKNKQEYDNYMFMLKTGIIT